jgi:hypothetical protein
MGLQAGRCAKTTQLKSSQIFLIHFNFSMYFAKQSAFYLRMMQGFVTVIGNISSIYRYNPTNNFLRNLAICSLIILHI